MGKAKVDNQSHKALPNFSQGRTSRNGQVAEWLSWVVAAILVLLPFHALFTTWAGSNFGHLDLWRVWKEIILIVILPPAAWLVWHSPKLKRWFVSSVIVRLFGLYLLLHIILGLWAFWRGTVTGEALVYSYIINLRFIAFFILCYALAASSNFLIQNWRRILLAPAAGVVTFGLVQKFLLPYDFLKHFGYGPKTIPAYQTIDNDFNLRRIQSTLRGANPLGAYLVLIIPALLISLRNKITWLAISLVSSLIVLFYSHSRSAWLGLIVSLGVLVYLGSSQKIRGWLMPLTVALILLGAGGLYLLRSNSAVQDTLLHDSSAVSSAQTSDSARWQALKNGASDIVHEPLGRGPGTAGPASFRNNNQARIAENYFLQIAQEIGVLGLGLFIAINFLVAKDLWAKRSNQLAKILLISLAGITFINLLSHAWTDDTLSYLWWGLAGVALATPAVASSPFDKLRTRK